MVEFWRQSLCFIFYLHCTSVISNSRISSFSYQDQTMRHNESVPSFPGNSIVKPGQLQPQQPMLSDGQPNDLLISINSSHRRFKILYTLILQVSNASSLSYWLTLLFLFIFNYNFFFTLANCRIMSNKILHCWFPNFVSTTDIATLQQPMVQDSGIWTSQTLNELACLTKCEYKLHTFWGMLFALIQNLYFQNYHIYCVKNLKFYNKSLRSSFTTT